MSADNMIVVSRINHSSNYNVAVMTWPEVEAAMDAAKKGIIQFTELLTFNQAYKRAIKLFKKHRTEYGIMPIDLVTEIENHKERLNVFVVIDDNKVRLETIDHVSNLVNNYPWRQDPLTGNFFVELDDKETNNLFRDRFNNYGYGILYLKNNFITHIEVLFAP